LSVNQFAVAAAILRDSDLIAVLPQRCVMMPGIDGALVFRPLPFKIPDVVLYLSWHQRSNALPSHQWFKQRVLEAALELNETASRAVSWGHAQRRPDAA
jgi:DNA-binding transcriptional LysR family regulator